ncbi:hypothetical protein K493DRAFT_406759 [Basidiobolus meristosporus CBS 931.73]|uniref:EamA domain-containing protein n=1 Tax=Basidiobolus meristosporus CBS 931.73 TaxID=1314790 RepID=A0A1Y1YIP9_9FUNG|nr:hypothetical protein K493DRAFT_406759 [Basidiobolus meristosporus CBS 931.73]|eukprot:ORX97917.1 hypothetical protein K493DRAFT_406759 [Basidiobolus meristosporus CBS 931.73]
MREEGFLIGSRESNGAGEKNEQGEIFRGPKGEEALFLFTGVFQTLSTQWLFYQGAADKLSFLTIGANYVGMTLVNYLIPRQEEARPVTNSRFPWLPVVTVALFDFGGNVFAAAGLFLVGSGIFQVIYSSVVVFTALLSRVILKRQLSLLQWLSLLVITLGLGLSALGTSRSGEDGDVLMGSLLVFSCTLMFASVYVTNEKVVSKPGAPTPEEICTWSLVRQPIETHGGNPVHISICYGLLVLASFGHSFTYFRLLGSVGAVSTGVLQALRAISVFLASSFAFCSRDTHQCFTREKAISTAIVVMGVTGFFWIGARAAPKIAKYDKVEIELESEADAIHP